jgi:4-alpha-glucanotransferase
MDIPRSSGILLHPTSLPGSYGIGELGPEAYRFADWLAEAGQRLWQVLPLGPTGYGDSPYQTFCAFAGNPLLVSLERLRESGHLTSGDLDGAPDLPADRVDYGALIPWKWEMLRAAYRRFDQSGDADEKRQFDAFCRGQAAWLDDYALFMALKQEHDGAVWTEWEPRYAARESNALEGARERLADDIGLRKYVQFVFARQWAALREYCHGLGIRLMGDMPIYVAHDSVDVWANRQMFHLDGDGYPTTVAGVPPDYFSKTGQLWGNPIYRWDYLAETGYAWWVDRFKSVLGAVDYVRLDHFRGFEAYWAVPAEDDTAENGSWQPGPKEWLFDTLKWVFGEDLPIVAENLGHITPEVEELRRKYGMPGMAVLQFAFGQDAESSPLPPHAFTRDCVAYTGTHDNDTVAGWWESLKRGKNNAAIRTYVEDYLDVGRSPIHWVCVRAMLASVADLAVFPVQDVLGLGGETRMNAPGTAAGNWQWRFEAGALTSDLAAELRRLTALYGRAPGKEQSPQPGPAGDD